MFNTPHKGVKSITLERSGQMLVLFETPAGYSLFKLKSDTLLDDPNQLDSAFRDPEQAERKYVHVACKDGCKGYW